MDVTSWLDYGFMRSALVAILIITPLFGLLGTMIVNKKMAYFSDALGHSALTGIAAGVVCGIQDTTISMVIFAVIFALLLNKIGSMNMASTDTIISVFLPARWQSDLQSFPKAAISAGIRAFLWGCA